MRRALTKSALAVVVSSALALAACGETTVESTDAPKEPSTTESATATESKTETTSETATSEQTSEKPSGKPGESAVASSSAAAGEGDEQPAREVTSVPEAGGNYSPEEEKFFDALRNKGVNVDGVEDQVAATGFSVCDGTTFTRDAVAGQLVEQRRTDLDPAATAELIDATAHDHLC